MSIKWNTYFLLSTISCICPDYERRKVVCNHPRAANLPIERVRVQR